MNANQSIAKEGRIWGPIFIFCTLALSAKSPLPWDLVVAAILGLYISAHLRMRGFAYALGGLALSAVFNHTFLVTNHLWQLGIEGSLASSFLIVALSVEQEMNRFNGLTSEIETGKVAYASLEEEMTKGQEAALAERLDVQEKMGALQKELEEVHTEHASLLILNEVLRKPAARHMEESEAEAALALDRERQVELLSQQLQELGAEHKRLSSTDSVVLQNRDLFEELNQARLETEQTHLINETLARLYAKESLKAKEADQEAASLKEQLSAARGEVPKVVTALQQELGELQGQLAAAHQQIKTVEGQFEKAVLEADQGRVALLSVEEVRSERNFLKQRLDQAMEELSFLQAQPLKQDPDLAEQLKFAQKKMARLSQVEAMLVQLKGQLEEKNQVLHESRRSFFVADTELQKLRMEKEALELAPLPKEIEQELREYLARLEALQRENSQLEELVTHLTESNKKKLKTNPPSDQELLF